MGKKIAVGVILILLSITTGGCWDIRYLDELAIVFAVGLDTSDTANLKVTVQVVNPTEVSLGSSKGGGGGDSSVTTYSETAPTFLEAIRKMTNKTSRALYFSHNQILVIGEDLAKRGIRQSFDFIERDPGIRTDFYVLVAKGAKAADVLKITTPVEKIPGSKIHDSIENVEKKMGTSYKVSMRDLIAQINSEKQEVAVGSIEITGDKQKGGSKQNIEEITPSALLKLSGMAAFKHEKLVRIMTLEESKGLTWINHRIKNTVIHIPCKKNGSVAIEVMHSNTKLKVMFQRNQPSISIHVRQEANIGEIICSDIDISDKATFNLLQKQTNEKVKKLILNTVDKVQEMETDIFGFADIVNKANPAYWKKNKSQWDDIFAEIPVSVEVETNIRREGVRGKSYYQKNP